MFKDLLEGHRKLRTNAKQMRDTFQIKYNTVVSEKKLLEDKVIELAGKFVLRTLIPFPPSAQFSAVLVPV